MIITSIDYGMPTYVDPEILTFTTGASTATAAAIPHGTQVQLYATEDCYLAFGATAPTAAATTHKLAKAGLVTTWKDVDKKATKIIKDKKNKDKEIPTIVFGGSLVSPGSAIVVPDTSEMDAGAKPVDPPKDELVAVLPPPKELAK